MESISNDPLSLDKRSRNQGTVRIRLTVPKASQAHNSTPSPDQARVIYLRFTPHEKIQLENEIFQWGYRGGDRQVAEQLSQNPTPFVEELALKLFRKWSFAVAVKRALAPCLRFTPSASADAADELLELFRGPLDRRNEFDQLQQLPGDSRMVRVDETLGDQINAPFFDSLQCLARGLGSDGTWMVAPHPEELPIWRLLAYQAWRNFRAWRAWPGVHEAATFARPEEIAMNQSYLEEFPFYEHCDPAWTDPEPLHDSESEDEEQYEPFSDSDSELEDFVNPTDFDDAFLVATVDIQGEEDPWPAMYWHSSTLRRRQKEIRKHYAMFEEADTWDVWILCQMVRCEEAIWGYNQTPGTEQGFWFFEQLPLFKETWVRRDMGRGEYVDFLQRRLPSKDGSNQEEESLVDLKQQWPLPLPREFIEFADYREYRFEEISDLNVIASLLESAGLSASGPDIEWDLIYLNPSRRDPLRQESEREHLHHSLHTPDDYIQYDYDKGSDWDHPGLCHPCECIKLLPTQLEQRNRMEDIEYEFLLQEGRKFLNGEGSSRAPVHNVTGEIQWRRKFEAAKLRKELREKHGRWREFPSKHYEYNHAGGNVVFNRRKLEDVPEFVKELDRFWIDWNDCMLIMGGEEEEDEDGNTRRVNEDTIYILETLPGIKRRWEQTHRA
ncbi:hypothetical protein V8F20_010658 [Naviculisporaceae sp. PSN 640]